MTEKSFDKDKMEEKEPLLRNEEPFRVEPPKVKPVLRDIPPVIELKKPAEVPPKEILEKKEEKTVVSPRPAKVKIETFPQTETKSSPFFRLLFILSCALMALALGLLLLSLLNVSIPPFLYLRP